MQEFEKGRLHIKVEPTKNSDEIKKTTNTIKEIDQQLNEVEHIKPKQCDCECGNHAAKAEPIRPKDDASSKELANLSIIVFPNPSPSAFTIRIKSNDSKRKVTVRVVNAAGSLIDAKNDLDPSTAIILGDNYKPGIYFAEVAAGSQRQTIKLVKQ